MAQYLISVFDERPDSATPQEMAAIDTVNEQLQAGGNWVFAGGLPSSDTATVVDGRDGEPVFTDGPSLESMEYLAGFWIIEAADLDVGAPARRAGVEELQPAGGAPAVPGRVTDVDEAIARAHREEWARVVANLTRCFGDLDMAEEMAAEAFATAVERWPVGGVPPSPGAWLTTTAQRKAIDRIRREARREDKHKEVLMLLGTAEPLGAIDDDRLRLVFTCCHPALAMEARIALTLRMVGGFTVAEIARAFLVQEPAVGRRITRAKEKIKAAKIPYRVPSHADLPARVTGVLAVLYLIFNEGYATNTGDALIRQELCDEAIRLVRVLVDLLGREPSIPGDPEVLGLLGGCVAMERKIG